MKKLQGFTLIELIIVIIILGILAVTAAPKFIDLSGDAKGAVMKGVESSIKIAMVMVNAKALLAGQTGDTGEVKIGDKFYALVYGYPAAAAVGTGDGTTGKGYGIENLLEIDSTDITFASSVFTHSTGATPTACIVTYTQATSSAKAAAATTDTGC